MSRANKRRTSRNQQLKSRQNASFKFITCVAIVVLVVLGYGASISYAKNQSYIAQELELLADLEEEMQRTEEIEEFKEYTQTDDYIEEVAKEKLNMAYPDEVVFVPMD